jgi:hypothetical protein
VSAEDHDEIWMLGRAERRADAGVAANSRLTASNAVVLLVLLAAEGVTILRVRELLTPHVFIGMVLIPPVLVKMASGSAPPPSTFSATWARCSGWPRATGCAGRAATLPGPACGSG